MRCWSGIALIVLVTSLGSASGEFFTAMADMEKLLHTEKEIVKTLDLYLQKEEQRLEKVKWLSKQYSTLYKAANQSVDQFLANPVNAYLLVKRLTADWVTATNLITSFENQEVVANITTQELDFPSDTDLSGAAEALIRLQEVYLLDAEAIANGKIKGTAQSAKLTAGDCYELGHQAYETSYFNISIAWMQQALDILEKEETKTADEIVIYEHMAYSYYMLKNYTAPIVYTSKILSIDPNNRRANKNMRIYRDKKSKEEAKKKGDRGQEKVAKPAEEKVYPEGILPPSVIQAYEKLCRGESTKPSEELSKLCCYTTSNNNAYLLLQPVKVEVLSLKPRFVVFHDIINDEEANFLKKMAIPKLARATVSNATTGEQQYANYRISKSSWLEDYDHPLVARLSQRVEDVTGLETKSAEALHVINYGIGGHYEPHVDFASPDDKIGFGDMGNRLATWIYYLSEVPAGGSTVFPTMGVEVRPIKGSAAFWYNLHKSGKGDDSTLHAACPVLLGSKWVANKWIHETGNEFRRLCSLDPKE